MKLLSNAQQDKLDRSRWEGCKWCDDTEIMGIYHRVGKHYCDKCGKPLTEEAWAELERRIG